MSTSTVRPQHPLRRQWLASALIGLTGVLGLIAHTPSLAHDDAYLDTLTAPHGGQIRMAGMWHLELVLDKAAKGDKPQAVDVYVTDHAGTKQEVKGATGSATLLSAGHKLTVPLKPMGDNRLHGEAPYTASPDLKAIVSVTMPGDDAQQARFTPLAPRAK